MQPSYLNYMLCIGRIILEYNDISYQKKVYIIKKDKIKSKNQQLHQNRLRLKFGNASYTTQIYTLVYI